MRKGVYHGHGGPGQNNRDTIKMVQDSGPLGMRSDANREPQPAVIRGSVRQARVRPSTLTVRADPRIKLAAIHFSSSLVAAPNLAAYAHRSDSTTPSGCLCATYKVWKNI